MHKLFQHEFFKRDVTVSLLCALVFTICFSLAGFDAKCEQLRDNIVRLHILANSDSQADQAIKLKVRDRLLQTSEALFKEGTNKAEALDAAEREKENLRAVAEQTIREQGADYPVTVSIGKAYFNTRVYDNFTLPAGEYDAVRVLIGEAKGKNWWCVLFPSMCVPAAGEHHSLQEAVDASAAEVAEHPQQYSIRFKTVEVYESVRNTVSRWLKADK